MIHKFKLFDKNIVLDVESGAVFVFDNLTFKILDLISLPMDEKCNPNLFKQLSEFSESDILDSYNQIYEIYKKNLIFSPEIDYTKFSKSIENSKIKAMCLHVAHDCNLRCAYCFASTGNFGGKRELMSLKTSKAAIDYLIENSGSIKNLEVDFFGGEPLLNFEVVEKTVEYARNLESKFNKNFRFTITTNGTLLDDYKINYINEHMNNVVLSLDGRKEVNDRIRTTINSSVSSYDISLPKFKKLVQKRTKPGRTDYYIRGTFTNKNLDFSKDVLHFYDCGFNQISIEPVVSDSNKSYSLNYSHLPEIFKQYECLAKKIIELKKENSKINFFHFMIDLTQGPCIVKRVKGCGCAVEYVAVAPNGDLFPCHQFVGKEKFKMGNIFSKKLDTNLKNLFLKANLINKSKCKQCWAKFFCSGGCNANNFNFNRDILKPHEFSCELEKKRIECAIAIKAVIGSNI